MFYKRQLLCSDVVPRYASPRVLSPVNYQIRALGIQGISPDSNIAIVSCPLPSLIINSGGQRFRVTLLVSVYAANYGQSFKTRIVVVPLPAKSQYCRDISVAVNFPPNGRAFRGLKYDGTPANFGSRSLGKFPRLQSAPLKRPIK